MYKLNSSIISFDNDHVPSSSGTKKDKYRELVDDSEPSTYYKQIRSSDGTIKYHRGLLKGSIEIEDD